MNKINLFLVVGMIIGSVVLVHAITTQEELSQLESELSSQGYDWLVNTMRIINLNMGLTNISIGLINK